MKRIKLNCYFSPIHQTFEKTTYLYCYFRWHLLVSGILIMVCDTKLARELVHQLGQTPPFSAQLDIHPSNDSVVYLDGNFGGIGMGKGILSYLGENRFVPLWTPTFAQRLVDHCFFWVQKPFLGYAYHP